MAQPEYYISSDKEVKVCKLKRSIYGLKQAAKAWYDELKGVLERENFIQSDADPCLYIMNQGTKLFLIIYVDDILLVADNENLMNQAEGAIKRYFRIVALGEPKIFLGFNIRRDTDGIFYLDQKAHIETLVNDMKMNNAKASSIPIDLGYEKIHDDENTLEDKLSYQRLIGRLLYIGVHARPDILAAVCILSQRNTCPRKVDWNEGMRVVRYLNGSSNLQLRLGNDNASTGSGLIVYSDANWAQNIQNRKSTSGYVVQLYGSTIAWGCKRQTCVALSTTEAEYIALTEACKETIWIRRLLVDMGEILDNNVIIYEDNQSCLSLLENPKLSNGTKHVDTRYHFIKELYENNEMSFLYCPTSEMVADIMTKPLGRLNLNKQREAMGLGNWTK